MVISGTALLLATLAALAAGKGYDIASDSVESDRTTLSRDEAKDILEYMSTPRAPQSEDAFDRYRNRRRETTVSEDVLQRQDEVTQTDFTDILSNPYWNSLSESEKIGILQEYVIGDYTGSLENVDFSQLAKDLGEYSNVAALGAEPELQDYANFDRIQKEAQAAIDADNERLLSYLNDDLQASGEAYLTARDAMLTQQHQRNAQTMDTMALEMSRARRNAIEAGASAGLRIAGNVNALLSAQNKMSQQSLDTSNQLAQMLLNQRNAEAGLRSQWRDAQMSTYDRVQERTASEMDIGQQRYQQAHDKWQSDYNDTVSDTNALGDRMLKYSQKSKY